MEKTSHMLTGSVEVIPFRCDNIVLMQIQEEYGTVSDFETKLIGLEAETDENGDPVLDGSGKRKYRSSEPSVRTVNFALTLMVNEGLEIEADMRKEGFTPLTEKQVVRMVDLPYRELSQILHEEFSRCFAVKK